MIKINKKVNCNKIAALSSYLFLSTLAIFIGPGTGICLASAPSVNDLGVNDFNDLEKAVDNNNSSVINIKADSITLNRELPVISHSLTISTEEDGSILNGDHSYRILEFNPNLDNITINGIHFKHGRNEAAPIANNGGGAVHIEERTTIAFNSIDFSNNKAVSHGGAIYSLGDAQVKNILTFGGKITFTGNESTSGDGGAAYVLHSDLIFGGEVNFAKNKNGKDGGAIYAENSNITFGWVVNFEENRSKIDGGAIHAKYSDLIFDGEVNFTNNKSKIDGGAIYSEGIAQINNILLFNGKATFTGNGSTSDGGGGAVYIKYSDLTFSGEVNFTNNKSKIDGGAIYSNGTAQIKNILILSGKATFTGNGSTISNGGAIYLRYSDLTFGGEVNFTNNSSKIDGGAICSDGNAVTETKNILVFNDKATFADNESSSGGGGGAVYMWYSDLIFNGETRFEKNKNNSSGGAIYSNGYTQAKNILRFNGRTIFSYNESTNGGGGAIYIEKYSDLIFNGEAEFTNNVSKNNGGAINSQGKAQNKNIFLFNNRAIFINNESVNRYGGAIYTEYSDLTFGGETRFEKNKAWIGGGAIYFLGGVKNILGFNSKTTFVDNKNYDSSGGAIYIECSDLIFNGETKFEKNKSNNNGGAIYFRGEYDDKKTLVFNNIATFTGNAGVKGNGGAIYGWYLDMAFGGEVEFKNNSSFRTGGAIMITGGPGNVTNAIFNGLATFESNNSKWGSAIYLYDTVNMTFNSGLKLINNTTGDKESGAIHMQGEGKGRIARITVVQKDLHNPTKFRGNSSNNGQGQNAFYLQRHAELNFILENGNIDLYDTIDGDGAKYNNTVTLEGSKGQFNI
ncbi:MAG: hypothetical protein LBP39_00330, partial [Rickettsiales bacterium]|nr:hypothetical protein [Rickettsiales bacterium]